MTTLIKEKPDGRVGKTQEAPFFVLFFYASFSSLTLAVLAACAPTVETVAWV